MSDWKTELIDVVEGRTSVTFTDELILQTAPTRTLIGSGCRLEHGIVCGNDSDGWVRKLMRIGVADHGWAYVEQGITGKSHQHGTVREKTFQALGTPAAEKTEWMLDVQDATYFPVNRWELLPTALHLSQYDIGQQVVFTHAEVMGRTGTIIAAHAQGPFLETPDVELTVRVKMKDGNPIEVKQGAVAAIVQDNDFEGTASVGLRYPAGSKVWVKTHVRAGQPFQWRPAISTGWKAGQLSVTFLDDGEQALALRSHLAPGDGPAPEAVQLAPKANGTNAVPRGKRAKKWNIPKA